MGSITIEPSAPQTAFTTTPIRRLAPEWEGSATASATIQYIVESSRVTYTRTGGPNPSIVVDVVPTKPMEVASIRPASVIVIAIADSEANSARSRPTRVVPALVSA